MYTFFCLLLSTYVIEFETAHGCVIFLSHSANLSFDWYILIGIIEVSML